MSQEELMTRGQSGNNKKKKKASLSQTPAKDIEKGDSMAEYAKEISALPSKKPKRENKSETRH